jgi:hypothetical protein
VTDDGRECAVMRCGVNGSEVVDVENEISKDRVNPIEWKYVRIGMKVKILLRIFIFLHN